MAHTIAPPATMLAYVGTPSGPELRRVPDPPGGGRPGQDVAGRVVDPAADGSGPPTGARVVAMVDFGGWAQRVAVPVARLAQLPDTVAAERAAGFGIAGLTALRALRRGETLLAALRRTAPRGHLVLLGSSSGEPAPITISSFRGHVRQTVHPFWVHGSGEPVGDDLAVLADLTARGALDPVVGWVSSWDRLGEAMQALRERRVAGKAILRVEH